MLARGMGSFAFQCEIENIIQMFPPCLKQILFLSLLYPLLGKLYNSLTGTIVVEIGFLLEMDLVERKGDECFV